MNGKNYTEQWRRKHKKRKRKSRHAQHHHHQEEEDLLQSQDLLAENDNELEPQKYDGIPQQEEEEVEHSSIMNVVPNDASRVEPQSGSTAVKVQGNSGNHDDASLSRAASMEHPLVETAPCQEDELKRLLSQALVDLSDTQDKYQQLQQAFDSSQQQCQQLQQALWQAKEKCEVCHQKYSSLKKKFHKWYYECLQQWAHKFRRGDTQDLPPGPDVVGGISPLHQAPEEEEESVLSALQPRRILQDSSETNSVTPSPWMQRPESTNTAMLQPKRLPTTVQRDNDAHCKENMEISSLTESEGSMRRDGTSVAAETHTKPTQYSETQFDSQANGEGVTCNASGTKSPSAEPHGDQSQENFVLPPEDDSSLHSEESNTQLDFVASQRRNENLVNDKSDIVESTTAFEDEETQLEGDYISRSETFKGNDDKVPPSIQQRSRSFLSVRKPLLPANCVMPSTITSGLNKDVVPANRVSMPVKAVFTKELPSEKSREKKTSSPRNERENEDGSQASFSQLRTTPYREEHPKTSSKPLSSKPASKSTASGKNASALRAMDGWTSNVMARTFVQTSMKPPAQKKQRSSYEMKPNIVTLGSNVKPDTVVSANVPSSIGKSDLSGHQPPRNPYARSTKEASKNPFAYHSPSPPAKAVARMEWSDDEQDESQKSYKYQEVVRCRHDRQNLKGHCCPECANFVDVVCSAEGGECFDRNEMLKMSRHRARHTPPSTPDGFWELSFADEKGNSSP